MLPEASIMVEPRREYDITRLASRIPPLESLILSINIRLDNLGTFRQCLTRRAHIDEARETDSCFPTTQETRTTRTMRNKKEVGWRSFAVTLARAANSEYVGGDRLFSRARGTAKSKFNALTSALSSQHGNAKSVSCSGQAIQQ